MNPEIKPKWLEALRSERYKQGRVYLRDGNDNYCCLGVLADVCGSEWEQKGHRYHARFQGEQDTCCLTDTLHEYTGVSVEAGAQLMNMNDHQRHTFLEIANWIEENL